MNSNGKQHWLWQTVDEASQERVFFRALSITMGGSALLHLPSPFHALSPSLLPLVAKYGRQSLPYLWELL
mgnify:CR=1 FL=1